MGVFDRILQHVTGKSARESALTDALALLRRSAPTVESTTVQAWIRTLLHGRGAPDRTDALEAGWYLSVAELKVAIDHARRQAARGAIFRDSLSCEFFDRTFDAQVAEQGGVRLQSHEFRQNLVPATRSIVCAVFAAREVGEWISSLPVGLATIDELLADSGLCGLGITTFEVLLRGQLRAPAGRQLLDDLRTVRGKLHPVRVVLEIFDDFYRVTLDEHDPKRRAQQINARVESVVRSAVGNGRIRA